MKKIMISFLLASLCIYSFSFAEIEGERFQQSNEAVKQATFGHIDAKGLKALIDSKTSFVLLDARGEKWHDGNIIPGATLAWYEDPLEDFEKIIPNVDSLIVVYCFTFTCPLSTRLSNRLIELGYKNVVEYPAGLSEWRDTAGYPVEPIIEWESSK